METFKYRTQKKLCFLVFIVSSNDWVKKQQHADFHFGVWGVSFESWAAMSKSKMAATI